jgi:hypothetical protein
MRANVQNARNGVVCGCKKRDHMKAGPGKLVRSLRSNELCVSARRGPKFLSQEITERPELERDRRIIISNVGNPLIDGPEGTWVTCVVKGRESASATSRAIPSHRGWKWLCSNLVRTVAE